MVTWALPAGVPFTSSTPIPGARPIPKPSPMPGNATYLPELWKDFSMPGSGFLNTAIVRLASATSPASAREAHVCEAERHKPERGGDR